MNLRSKKMDGKSKTILSVNQLEDRSLPASNVTAYVSDGVLWVNASDPNVGVWVNATGPSSVIISPYGNNSSLIDGSNAPLSLSGIDYAIGVNLSGKGDFLYLSGAQGNLSVVANMSGGGDGLAMMNDHYTGSTQVAMGANGNVVALGGDDFTGPATFNLEGGNNQLSIGFTQFGDVSFLGGVSKEPNSIGLDQANFHDKPILQGFTYVWGSLAPHAGNASASVAPGGSVTIDLSALDTATAGTLNTGSIVITSQPKNGKVVNDGNGSVTYTNTGTTAGSDSFTYTIQDSSGAVSNDGTVDIDITEPAAPTPTVSSTTTSPTNESSIPITVKFSSSVTGFSQSGITVTNGTISNFTGSGTTYTFDVAPTADGAVTVKVPADVSSDSNGKQNVASNTLSITVDRTPPTVNVTTTATSPTNSDAIPVTVTFDKAVTGFASTGVTVSNGTVADFAGSGTTYTMNILPTADGVVTVTVPASSAKDSAGNENSESNTLSVTSLRADAVVTIDPLTTNVTAPTLSGTISDSNANVTVKVGTQTIDAAISGNVWTAVVPTALIPGTYSVTATATDKAGNVSTATSASGLIVNTTDPTVTITAPADPTTTATPTLAGTVSEANSSVSIQVGGQTFAATVSGTTWSATVPTALANGTYSIKATATDTAGNVGTATGTNDLVISVTGTGTKPQVTVNPSTTKSTMPTITGTVSDPLATVVLTIGTTQTPATVNGNVWTAVVTAPLTAGTYDLSVAATDTAGTGNGSLTGGLVITTTNPTVTVNTQTATTATPTITGTVLSANDTVSVNVGGQTFAATVSGTTWSAAVPTALANGTYTIVATATDPAGNVGSATSEGGLVVNVASTSTLPFSLTDSAWKTLSSGVRYWDVKTGSGTTPVAAGNSITVNYIGYLLNGTVFDSSFSRNTSFTATLTTANLIAGWVDGIPGMLPGGERRLDIPASLAYGSTGQGSIPPNAEIVFDITLISATA